MSDAVADLQPPLLWKHFAAITAIPRSSRNEAAIARYVTEVATRAGCQVKRDRTGTLLIKCRATPGLETAPSVCLQGHLGVVSERANSPDSDGGSEPQRLQREGNLLRASHVGADNGIAVAAMLALIEDPSKAHGPLECLLTLDEENALSSAKTLDSSLIESRLLINIGSEAEGALYIGRSGGRDTLGTWKPLWEELSDKVPVFSLKVKGLKGGRAGVDVDQHRGHAIKILVRLLLPLHERGVRIGAIDGGGRRNAVPREAEAVLYIPTKRQDEIRAWIENAKSSLMAEFGETDPDLQIEWTELGLRKGKVLKRVQIRRILHVINAMPHGVLRMSRDIEGLVHTSTNLFGITTGRKLITLATSQRSASPIELDTLVGSVASLLDIGGAEIQQNIASQGWRPNRESELLHLAEATFEKVYHRKPEIKATHAGLDCGIVGEKAGEIDMLSFGPTLQNPHSSDESLDIASVSQFWDYLGEMVRTVGERHRPRYEQLH